MNNGSRKFIQQLISGGNTRLTYTNNILQDKETILNGCNQGCPNGIPSTVGGSRRSI